MPYPSGCRTPSDYGIEAAILIRNLTWVEEHGLSKEGWTAINPVEFLDDTNLPMSAQAVRRALGVLVKAGRLERKRNARYGDNYYKYRLVDTHHLGAYEEPDTLPLKATNRNSKMSCPPNTMRISPQRRQTEKRRIKRISG